MVEYNFFFSDSTVQFLPPLGAVTAELTVTEANVGQTLEVRVARFFPPKANNQLDQLFALV